MGVVLSDGEHDHESLHSGPFVSPSLSLCLLCLALTLLCMNLHFFPSLSLGEKKTQQFPKACKPWHVSQQVTVKRQTPSEQTRSESRQTDKEGKKG